MVCDVHASEFEGVWGEDITRWLIGSEPARVIDSQLTLLEVDCGIAKGDCHYTGRSVVWNITSSSPSCYGGIVLQLNDQRRFDCDKEVA